MAIGIMGGGILIRYFKPKARSLLVYMFFVELVASFSIFTVMFFGCPTPIFPNTELINGKYELRTLFVLIFKVITIWSNSLMLTPPNSCNNNCGCTTRVYQPVCGSDGISTYFSPCYAGCKTVDTTTNPIVC